MEVKKSVKRLNLKKTPPATPNPKDAVTPKENITPQLKDSAKPLFRKISPRKPENDYSGQIDSWVRLFHRLNSSLEDLYQVCSAEGYSLFTEGVVQTLSHSLSEFSALKDLQSDGMPFDIRESDETVDGELLSQLVNEDNLSAAQALVLMIRERAAVRSDDEDESYDDSMSGTSVVLDYTRSLSMSPRRVDLAKSMLEKLSSRDKKSPSKVKLSIEERMSRAESNKTQLFSQKQEEFAKKAQKIKEIKAKRASEEAEKKRAIELQISLKQSRADEQHEAYLQSIKERAKNENLKTDEIAFILGLKAGTKRMSLDSKIERTRKRRQNTLEIIKQKQLERMQKEELAEKRRLEIKAEKQIKIQTTQQRQAEAENRRMKILEEKKSKAEELGRDKRRAKPEPESIFAADISAVSKKSLKRPISARKKSAEDSKRDDDYDVSDDSSEDSTQYSKSEMKSAKFKIAFITRGKHRYFQKVKVDETLVTWCSVCNAVLAPELASSHLTSPGHMHLQTSDIVQGNLACPLQEHLADSDELKELRESYLKKRAKRLKVLATQRCYKHGADCVMGRETSGTNKNRLLKLALDLDRCVSHVIDHPALESIIKETIRILEMRREVDLHVMRQIKFIPCLMEVIKKIWSCARLEIKNLLSSIEIIVKFLNIFSGLAENRTYMVVTNRMIPLAELTCWLMSQPSKIVSTVTFFPELFHLLTVHLKHRIPNEHMQFRELYVEFLLNCGLLFKFKQKFKFLQGPIDLTSNNVSMILLKSVAFLEALTTFPGWGLSNKPAFELSMYLTENSLYVFEETEMVGIPYLLVCILLSEGPPRQSSTPKMIPQSVLTVAIYSIRFLNNLARLHLPLFQATLSSEQYSDEMFHLMRYLLHYCTEHLDTGPEDVRELLHEVILMIGYFVTLAPASQDLMNRGETCIIQRLCALPFAYFSDKKYTGVLFPTLIAIVYKHDLNFSILSQEMSVEMLLSFIELQCSLYPEDEQTEEHKDLREPKRETCSISSGGSSSNSMLAAASYKLIFTNRFPRHMWQSVIEYLRQAS